MKLKSLIATLGLLTTGTSFGATGIFGSYIDIFTTTSTVYKGENFSSNPNIQGASFGTLNLADTLIITRSQIDTFKNGGGNVTGAEIQYRVYLTAGSPGSFSQQSYGFQANSTYTDIGGMTITGGGDQAWGNNTDINLNPGVAGNYTLEVFFKAFTNEGDRFSNNGGNNFKATFTVVPEPSAALLGGLGVLALMRRRRI
jgi:hypothetical protein